MQLFYSDYSFLLTRVSCVRPSASFDKYTEVERLEGDSRYCAGPHGLHDAENHLMFIDIPLFINFS
ncbi:putative ubiquitinyl hydrolase 1 [Helianthus annuus]|nr:putative ubiquitinyl hydrolase 1 [Helianthus annuus]